MKPTKALLLFFLTQAYSVNLVMGQDNPMNLLSGTFTPDKLEQIVLSPEQWHPYPKAGEYGWQEIPEKVRQAHLQQAEQHLHCDWETPKASVFLEYVRNGNRSNYEKISFGRRAKLAELVIAECIENKGRFLDDIVNGIWTICEETYWGVPAHLSMQKKGSGLPDVTEPTVDLFAAETGMLLAWVYYLVGEQLATVAPLIQERIAYEVNRRILQVNLSRDDFGWMGLNPGLRQRVNNWNPWICSNWLAMVLILETNPARRAQAIYKIMRCLDQFMNPYPKDGGCDEGPVYWGRAGGSLFDCLKLLFEVSNGNINIFDKPLVQEIGRYIYRAHIGADYFINFADASARVAPNPMIVFLYGKSIQDQLMMGFGAHLARQQQLGQTTIKEGFGCLTRVLLTLFNLNTIITVEPQIPLLGDCWFPELQVMTARSFQGSTKGLYLAAQGGHNAESHNHNDVGNFIVYADGYPVIIDVGVETYTAKTFSNRRYEIWTMQSAYHNLPTINGVMQNAGRQYQATNVNYSSDDNKAVFSLNLAKAYPDEANIKFWQRTITLNRGDNVVIQDNYQLNGVKNSLQMTLMTWQQPEQVEPGRLKITITDLEKVITDVSINYDKTKFTVDIEKIPITDQRLLSSWGEQIYRILLTTKKVKTHDEFSLIIE